MSRLPNVLYVIIEDCGPHFGCYGQPLVRTPNLDAFAADAIRFSRAFSTSPVCSVSRSALMTGCYQTAIGAHHHRVWSWNRVPLPAPARHICDWFRTAGYYTCNLQPTPEQRSGPWATWGAAGCGKLDLNFAVTTPTPGDPFDGSDWRQRAPGQPFFAHVTIAETHRGPGWKVAREQPAAERVNPDELKLPPYYPDHPIARDDYANYLDAIHLADGYIGQLLARLKDEGLADNTVVVISSDHGECHFRSKQFLYDGGLHIPLLIRRPDGVGRGTVDDRLVSGIDLAPTMLGFAGVRPSADAMHGHDLFAPETPRRECVFAARDRMDMSIDRMRCVRTERFKYIRNDLPGIPYMQANAYKEREYPTWNLVREMAAAGTATPEVARFAAPAKPLEELYDLGRDPHELHNLALDAEHAPVIKQLREQLVQWCARYDRAAVYENVVEVFRGYQGRFPEDPPVPRPSHGR